VRPAADPYEAELAAARLELRVLTPPTRDKPVGVDAQAFTQTLVKLARHVRPSTRPWEKAQHLLEEEREVELLAQVEDGRIVRMVPLDETRTRSSHAEETLTREYLRWCERTRGGGDCLGLLADGASVRGEDRYALSLAIALGGVLDETGHALREMANPRAVLTLVLCMAATYLMLWVLPEPLVSKGLATALTVALLAWLTVDTVWSLMRGWVSLVEEADRATTFEQLRAAGERYGETLGQNTARVLMLLVTAALGGTAVKLAEKLPLLPGFARATAQAQAQGGPQLAAAAEVESVAVSSEGTFSLLMRGRGGAGSAAPAGPRPSGTTVIRHQGGNQQVAINGQRWHVPANKSPRDIPAADPVGDKLQAAATQATQRWSPRALSEAESLAIERALSRGQHWLARLLERQARGRFVERTLKEQFRHLRWSQKGVDAVDPATGLRYELLSGTESNLALHGQRMAEVFFRMITF
jgi:hypothetical protein